MTTIELRQLGLTDLRAIEEIERRSYRTPWSRSMFAGELAKASSICLGAFDVDGEDGKLCGYLIVSRYVDAWHIMNVATDPDHRGRGIATMLLERLFELTADDVRRGFTLEVRVSNATAIGLYERLGFQARGIRRGYYTDNREDALIMWKDPLAAPSESRATGSCPYLLRLPRGSPRYLIPGHVRCAHRTLSIAAFSGWCALCGI